VLSAALFRWSWAMLRTRMSWCLMSLFVRVTQWALSWASLSRSSAPRDHLHQNRHEQAGSLGSCASVASIERALNRTAQLSNRKRLVHHRPHRFDRLRGRGGRNRLRGRIAIRDRLRGWGIAISGGK
jgi:hypothetical protein